MVNHGYSLDAAFRALADPTRRAIIERLSRGQASVTELAEPFEMTLPAVSKHVTILEDAGLVGAPAGRVGSPQPLMAASRPWADRAVSLAGTGTAVHVRGFPPARREAV